MSFTVNRGRKLKSLRHKPVVPSKPRPIWEQRIDSSRANALLGSQPITSTIGALAAGSIIASISYHVGYLLRIDGRLISFFSIQDVVASTQAVVPVIALIGLFSVGFAMVTTKKRSPTAKEVTEAQKKLGIFIAAVMTFALVISSFQVDIAMGIFALLMLIMGMLIIYLTKQQRVGAASFYFCAMLLLIALFPFAIFGSNNAEVDLLSDRRPHRITVGSKTSDVLILLANAEILIVRDDPRIVRVIPRRLINEIKILEVGKPTKSGALTRLWQKMFPSSSPTNPNRR